MFEIIFEIIGELVLQLTTELLVELGVHSAAEPFRKPPNPWLAALGYAILGLMAGGVSLYLVPALVQEEPWRTANLVVTPLLAGLAMAAFGAWRSKRGQQTIRLDRFSYGYLFALTMALVRFHLSG
ncbi:hypothetical protein [Xanthomonas arboricola]|uniref:hypothetical protein n=1 Tax=Xanthomonas arboricola TaxID=56448 RepID=UPI0014320F49|nr:hypothetical protein [Xanthomonas arboricola]NJB93267.1 VIT1/CCC1 family predicted Fe2+/Mn2+ transporter [Xanthomonas arboricola]